MHERIGAPPRKAAQERAALEAWAPQLPGAPRLLPGPGLRMAEVPGAPVGPSPAPEVLAAAGAFLKQLHAIPHDDPDPLPLGQALARRAAAALTALPPAEVPGLDARLRPLLDAPAGLRRVPCHRDFQPGNWRWGPDGLGVIDWEHARADLSTADLCKVLGELELDLGPFWAGYGPPEHPALLPALLALHGAATLAWGLRHRDPAFVALGRRVLGRAPPAGGW